MSGHEGLTPTVLIVDDEETTTDVYARVLADEYVVRKAYNGKEALEKVDDSVDVVLLDRRMGEMSGDEVLEEIQRRKLDCRVAMVTAIDPDFDIVELGFDDYVVKPLDKDAILDLVDRLLKLDEYDELCQELSSLKVKRNVLTMEKADAELADSEEYRELERRIEELTTEIENMEEELEGTEAVVDRSADEEIS